MIKLVTEKLLLNGVIMEVNRICHKGKQLTHQEAVRVYEQLQLHLEVCDDCDIKPCIFAEYMYGKLMDHSEGEMK